MSCLSSRLSSRLDQSEVEHLDEVDLLAQPANEQVGRFNVAMHHAQVVCFFQGIASLPDQENDPPCWLRTVATHEVIHVKAVEQFHYVIEAAFVGHAEVIKRHCVRGAQGSDGLRLLFEALTNVADAASLQGLKDGVRTHHLHRGVAPKQPMARTPNLAHAALAQKASPDGSCPVPARGSVLFPSGRSEC